MRVKKIFIFFIKSTQFLFILLTILTLLCKNSYASFELNGSSARIQAMGQAYVALANTPGAIFINCSGLAQLNYPAASVFYSQPFGLKELSYGSIAAIIPTQFGAIATGITCFGNELYREQSLLFSVSRSMRQKFYYGVNLHYMKLQIQGYGSDFSLEMELGFLAKMTSKLNWGFFATNINRAALGNQHDPLPQTFNTGVSFFPVADLIVNMDIYKNSIYPLEFRCGMEYTIFHRIALRSGFATEPSQFCAGFGILFSNLQVDYAVTTHQNLGLTHHFSLRVNFKKKKERSRHNNRFYTEPF